MELSLLLQQMKFKWNEYYKQFTPPHSGQKGREYEYSLTAQLAFTKMGDVIKQLESDVYDPNGPVTSEHIKLITSCFETHFDGIKNTDKIYFTSTDTPDTMLYLDIATYLTGTNNLARGKNRLQLLAPSVVSWFNQVTSSNHKYAHLHTLILSDDNQSVMEVGFIENKAIKRGMAVWYDTDPIMVKAGKHHFLNEGEVARVVNHSELLSEYYELREQECSGEKGNGKQGAEALEQKVRAALLNEKYNGYKVTATYPDCKTPGKLSGHPKLTAYLLDNVDRLFLNRQQLFDYMCTRLKPNQWEAFIASMDPDVFFNLVIGPDVTNLPAETTKMEKIQQSLSAETLLNGDAKYKKLALFCLECAYWNARNEDPDEYTSKLGKALAWTSLPGKLFAYPKNSKGMSDREIN